MEELPDQEPAGRLEADKVLAGPASCWGLHLVRRRGARPGGSAPLGARGAGQPQVAGCALLDEPLSIAP